LDYRRFVFMLERKESFHDSTSPTVTIPPTAGHTFKADPSYEGECEIHSKSFSLYTTRYLSLYSGLKGLLVKVKPLTNL